MSVGLHTCLYVCAYRYADKHICIIGRDWVQATLRAETRCAFAVLGGFTPVF